MELTLDEALKKGVKAYQAGQTQEAERLYSFVLNAQPNHPEANHNMGVLAVSVNKADTALPLFKTAIEANPKIEQFWLSYIDALIKEKQFDNAKAVLEQGKNQGVEGERVEALEESLTLITEAQQSSLPKQKNSLKLSEKRKKLAENKNQRKAKRQNLKGINPSEAEINNLLQHYQNGRFSDAEKLAISITQKFPTHQFGWKVLGVLLKNTGRVRESLVSSQKSVQLAPQDAEAHSNLGITLQELGRLDEAEVSYKQAIALKSDYAEAHSNLGNTLKELGRLDEAETSYRQAIALKPHFATAHYNLGNTLQELGRLEEAEASYKQAIVLKPDYAEAHSNLGTTLKELGRLDEAEASYTQAIVLKSDYAEAYRNLAITLQNLNRWDEAEVSYSQAIFLKPDYDDALIKRGQLLLKRNEFERALRDFEFCNNHRDSILYALIALYALGRIDEMYVKFNTHFEMDDVNIGLEAFSSFIYEKEKRDTGHYFCRNPMDFLYFSNLATHIEDPTSFTEGLIEDLRKKPVNWNPSSTSTNNGFQGRHNLFHNPRGKIRNLQSIIMHELVLYYQKFKNESCSYIQKWPSQKHLVGWHIILKQHGYQTPHIHTGGWLSGVIYLKLVPPLGKDEGAIEFSLNGENYTDSNSPKLVYQPELGDIVFFPSSLHHRTIPFTTDTDRIIVSFDLMPKEAKH